MQTRYFPPRNLPDADFGQNAGFGEILRLSLAGLVPPQGALSHLLDRLEVGK